MDIISAFISFFNDLPTISKTLFILCFCSLLVMHWTYLRSKRAFLPIMLVTALLMASSFATIDPFFHTWDESFHALVAKNLSESYLSPHLINENLFGSEPEVWIGKYIWLHKPPLSLWQMAVSIDLLGETVFAVRLPSILAFGGTCLFIYKIGERLFDKKTAYYGALLFLLYQFGLEQVAGIHTADHIDVAFTFYVTASFWAWITFRQEHKTVFLFLIGFFAGLAVLTKWLAGLLVFGVWGIHLISLIFGQRDLVYKETSLMLRSLGIALIVFLPWNVYAALKFPVEYWYEFDHARRHFYEVIELHGGDFWYYWHNLSTLFGSGTLIPFVIVLSTVCAISFIKNPKDQLATASFIFIPYAFFTLASTKMENFVTIVSPIILLCVSAFFVRLSVFLNERTKLSRQWSFVLLPFFIIFFLRPKESMKNHRLNDVKVRAINENKRKWIKGLEVQENAVYFYDGASDYEQITHMFYHNNLAISGLPNSKQIDKMNGAMRNCVIIYKDDPPDNSEFPKETRFIKMPDKQTLALKR